MGFDIVSASERPCKYDKPLKAHKSLERVNPDQFTMNIVLSAEHIHGEMIQYNIHK